MEERPVIIKMVNPNAGVTFTAMAQQWMSGGFEFRLPELLFLQWRWS
jgi:hypothetical protein